MEVRLATDPDSRLWDEIISYSPDAAIFHTWKWLKIMEKHSRKRVLAGPIKPVLYPLMISTEDEIFSVIPIYLFDGFFGKMAYSPPPAVECAYLGPVFNNCQSLIPRERYHRFFEFQAALHEFLVKDLHAKKIFIRTPTGFEDPRSFSWGSYTVAPKFTYLLDLGGGEEFLWKNLRNTVKKSIRRSEKVGIEFLEGTKEDLEPLFRLMKERKRTRALMKYFQEIYDAYNPQNVRIFTASHQGEILSALVITVFKNRVSSWFGTPRMSYKGVSPNEFLHWHLIQWAIEQGMECFELVGADDYPLFAFKNKFNATLALNYRLEWNSPGFRVIGMLYNMLK